MKQQTHKKLDGAAFFDGPGLHALLYETLYGTVPNLTGDIEYYDKLADQAGTAILDAGCGTGRVFSALARADRRIHAFDASETLLSSARSRLVALPSESSVELSRQRLESFYCEQQFDLILLAYYGFSYLLDVASRAACLRHIADHLAPEGRAVLHLPAPRLLSREVSRQELEAMHSERTICDLQHRQWIVEQTVLAMPYDPALALRSVELEVTLKDGGGRALRRECATMHYACIDTASLTAALEEAGLRTVQTLSGFVPEVNSELILILARL